MLSFIGVLLSRALRENPALSAPGQRASRAHRPGGLDGAGRASTLQGTGSVQGFATTLLLGVITSMITAIVVTRFLLTRFVRVFHEPRLFVAVKPAADAAVEGEAK